MRLFSRPRVPVAYVGAHNPITQRDMDTINLVSMSAPEFFPKRAGIEIVNLDYGRDFLAESRTYDAVVVFSVFRGHTKGESSSRVSPLSTVENWRRRLAATGARMIGIVSLGPYSLDGWQLDQIPGYEITTRNESVAIYRRI